MIPKVIHYCWFGGNSKSALGEKCIESWKKFFPDYEITEWNESNYDIASAPDYVRQAYDAKKWAFVSDYVRFDILYRLGGIYFDTDVEVIKPFDDIVGNGPFMGCETDGRNGADNCEEEVRIAVAPGLGIGAEPGMEIYREILDSYASDEFVKQDGSFDLKTVVTRTTEILLKHGLADKSGIQSVCGIAVYPSEYFCPYSQITDKMNRTPSTHSVHWYDASWWSEEQKKKYEAMLKDRKKSDRLLAVKKLVVGVIGEDNFEKLRGRK